MKKKIGIIGFGNMGSAIAEGVKREFKVLALDKDKEKTRKISGIKAESTLEDLIREAEIIIFAVKPQDLTAVFTDIDKNKLKGKLFISIVAGISTGFIETHLGKVRVIRAMPNLPAKIGQGMICLCKGRYAKKNDLNFTKQLFKKIGDTLILKEEMMDRVTAISGSGPGFLYDIWKDKSLEEIKETAPSFATSLTASASAIGFALPIARKLAQTTTRGSIAYLEETGISPDEAKKQVASKGGTTEAGLKALHKTGSLLEAVKAAWRRARELVRR